MPFHQHKAHRQIIMFADLISLCLYLSHSLTRTRWLRIFPIHGELKLTEAMTIIARPQNPRENNWK